MKNIEMHCHSTRSDGRNTPEEVISEAVRLDLDFLALTDHDTIAPKWFQDALKDKWIKTCDSVEISAQNEDMWKSLHLVSYAKIFHDSLHRVLEESRHGKMSMKWGQFDILIREFGFEWSREGFDSFMQNKLWREPVTSNKYDMSRYIMSEWENQNKAKKILWNLATSNDIVLHFYLECLKREWKLYEIYWYEVAEYEPSVEKTVDEVVNKSWWIVSMAHPNVTFWGNKGWVAEFERTIWDYVQKWVQGVEINTMASSEWIHSILKARQKFDLILTFWSDCHEIGYDGSDEKHATIGQKNSQMLSPDMWKRTYRWSSFTEDSFWRFQEVLWI